MKYIDADRLKAEIKRLKKYSEESKKEWIHEGYNQNVFAEDCRIKSFDKLLSFIDSLQQEQTDVDLEKAIDTFFKGWKNSPDYFQALNAEGECVSIDEIIEIVRHFFYLGLNTRKKETI